MVADIEQQSLSLLLAQDRSGTYCSTSFRRTLDHYAHEVLQNCNSLGPVQCLSSFEALSRYVGACNLGSLVQHLCARPSAALAVALAGVYVVRECARRTDKPTWNILIVQPVINLARLFRASGRRAECLRILNELHQIVVLGHPGRVFGLDFNETEAQWLKGASIRAEEVVTHNLEVERLKCAIAERDYESVRCLTDRIWEEPRIGWQLKLELRLKAEILSGESWRVPGIVRQAGVDEPWVALYIIDALITQGLSEKARAVISSMSEMSNSFSGEDREIWSCALAVRAASAGDYDLARRLGTWAWTFASATESEVGLIRAGTLLGNLELLASGERYTLNQLWPVVERSRHNYERFVCCTALALLEHRSGIDSYLWGAESLLNCIPPTANGVKLALDLLASYYGTEDMELTTGEGLLETSCPAAEAVRERFEQSADSLSVGQEWRALLSRVTSTWSCCEP